MKKSFIALSLLAALTAGCGRRVPQDWTQDRYQNGMQMQPDHGWFYYYMMYSIMNRQVRPTYHVYVPRVQDSPTLMRDYQAPAASPRTTGGFSRIPAPSGTSSSPSRSYTSPRSSGGFSSPSRSYSSPRSSGGFSGGSSRSSSSRSSGGFGKR